MGKNDMDMIELIRKAALGNVAFLAENMPTARHLAEFQEACGRIAVRDEVAVDDVAVDDADKKAVGCDEKKTLALRLDESDYLDIIDAVSLLGSVASDHAIDRTDLGSCVAEICRDWDRRVTGERKSARKRTENCDGTVTCHGVDVTVSADALEGRVVLAVRPPKDGECFLGWTHLRPSTAEGQFPADSPRLILGPKPQQPAPPQSEFREGGFYRRRNGQVTGPLMRHDMAGYSWRSGDCDDYWNHYENGRVYEDRESNVDILPGEVIVWRRPESMPADEWDWRGEFIRKGEEPYIWRREAIARVWSDWTDPPRVGRWKVVEGQEYATWDGE